MNKILLTPFFFLIVVLAGCSGNSIFKPTVTGSTFDVVVVGSSKIWNGAAGHSINDLLLSPMPCLPEDEANFNVIHIIPSSFDNVMKPARNILFYDVDPNKYTKVSVHYSSDIWAHPQAIVKLTAPSDTALSSFIKIHGGELTRYFTDAEENRSRSFYSTYRNEAAIFQVQRQFGVDMLIPTNLDRMKVGTNVLWVANNNLNVNQNILIFKFPYTSSVQFSPKNLVAVQDSFCSVFIPGPTMGSYMVHEKRIPFVTEVLKHTDSDYCVEVRGMWRCEGDVMGGPFVSRSFLSADHSSIITAMAFLFAPGKNKRNTLRMLESCIGSLQINSFKLPKADSTAVK